MATYNLQSNEAVLLKEESVAHGGSLSYTDELVLTNLNLVLIKKGIFGNGKGIHVFPLNQVKVYNGQAQALVGKKPNGLPALDVYFLNGQEKFSFQTGGRKKVPNWASKINLAVTGGDSSGPGKCTACGAPLSGTRGSTITCEYCGSAAQL